MTKSDRHAKEKLRRLRSKFLWCKGGAVCPELDVTGRRMHDNHLLRLCICGQRATSEPAKLDTSFLQFPIRMYWYLKGDSRLVRVGLINGTNPTKRWFETFADGPDASVEVESKSPFSRSVTRGRS
jgi:hypothetical protein